ncbi:hypothetical protein T484DRAFT_1922854, partial [Baffinella frigidus]
RHHHTFHRLPLATPRPAPAPSCHPSHPRAPASRRLRSLTFQDALAPHDLLRRCHPRRPCVSGSEPTVHRQERARSGAGPPRGDPSPRYRGRLLCHHPFAKPKRKRARRTRPLLPPRGRRCDLLTAALRGARGGAPCRHAGLRREPHYRVAARLRSH